jgi:hypothetical protein
MLVKPSGYRITWLTPVARSQLEDRMSNKSTLPVVGALLVLASWPLGLVAIVLCSAWLGPKENTYYCGGLVWVICISTGMQILIRSRTVTTPKSHGSHDLPVPRTASNPVANTSNGNPITTGVESQMPLELSLVGTRDWAMLPYPPRPADRMSWAPDSVLRQLTQQAMSAYPQARGRFLTGLSPGHEFFVKVRLYDATRTEDVFVKVQTIADGLVLGHVNSPVVIVQGHWRGEPVCVTESELLDWVITNPDGSEDGNLLGKYCDTIA